MKALLGIIAALLIAAPPHAKAGTADTIQSFGPQTFRQIVAKAGNKPLVVLVWSLDCAYCIPSFQALAAAQAKHGIEVATVMTDPVDDAQARQEAAGKLTAGGLKGQAWGFGPWPEAQLRYSIDPAWRGELPRSYWFVNDRPVGRYSGTITAEVIARHFGLGK